MTGALSKRAMRTGCAFSGGRAGTPFFGAGAAAGAAPAHRGGEEAWRGRRFAFARPPAPAASVSARAAAPVEARVPLAPGRRVRRLLPAGRVAAALQQDQAVVDAQARRVWSSG